ncbi:MAG: 30S ribosome-binding factor RbfA [Actinomycetia bacterium]|nr:30S ribosome-binding factor RbfA [Actinomycetes bacterium]
MDRIKKLAIDIQREISFIINTRIKDPRVGFVTVTDTRLSPDGKHLDIFVSIMGKDDPKKKRLIALKKSSGFIKKNLIQRMRLRNVPELKFIYDDSVDRGLKISQILKEIDEDEENQDER